MQRQAEEQERQRQLQLAAKLELMRQKKREFLESQRAATLARMAESQAAMQAKRETNRTIPMQYPQEYHQPQSPATTSSAGIRRPQEYMVQPQVFSRFGGGNLDWNWKHAWILISAGKSGRSDTILAESGSH